MPKVFDVFGFSFYFFSDESEPLEPVHVHVSKRNSSSSSKFWINSDGTIEMEHNHAGYKSNDLKRIMNTIRDYQEEYIEYWEEYFGCKAIYHDTYKTKEESIDKPRFNPNLGKSR
ncbi:protein of unknown function [Eubacterium uniforme]|uniref:DUF4160 domain-containing protein n=1 Tax=Eubacterium uniforme TaxID=39495 RepID=A0A1T4W785_9FIRM|nr:DUF4160 domain-containing protein [Eubacterium uniforme]SKA73140.1 protein of unknown function [Eubacterium uniforme]